MGGTTYLPAGDKVGKPMFIGVHFFIAELYRRAAAQKIGLFNAFGWRQRQ